MANRIFTVVLLLIGSFGPASLAEAQLFPFLRRPAQDDDDDGPPGRNAAGKDPRHEQSKTEADKAYRSGDFEKTIKLTSDVLRQNPRDSVAYYLRASARVELGNRRAEARMVRDGVADARESIRYDTQKTTMYYLPYLYGMKSLAAMENRREHAEVAVTIATQVLGVAGLSAEDKANILFQRAQAQLWLAKPEQAISDLEEAIRAVPMHFGARASLADAYVAAGKTAEAEAVFNKLVEAFPESPLSYNNRGMFHQRKGKYDEALSDLTRAIERDPNYFHSYTNRGFTLLQMDNPIAAEVDLTQSLKINAQQPFVYSLRGLARLAQGNMAGAIQDQRAVVGMNPKDAVAHGDLGFLLFFSGDFAAAAEEFDAALAINAQARHLIPWRIAALKRSDKGKDLKETYPAILAKDAKQREWIDHLAAFLLEAETEADLLAAAGAAPGPLKNDETCEAQFFIATRRAGAGKAAEATEAYQRALATKSRHLSAYRGAQYAIRKSAPEGANTSATAVVPSNRDAKPATK